MLTHNEDGSINIKGYGFVVGKFPYKTPMILVPKRIKEAMRIVVETDGLIGVAPIQNRTLLIYETLNDAKIARNKMYIHGIRVYSHEIEEIDTDAERSLQRYV